jgi:hypothetical protein
MYISIFPKTFYLKDYLKLGASGSCLAIWVSQIGRIAVQSQPEQNVNKTNSQPIAWHSGINLSYQAMWEAEIRGMVVPSHLGQKIL